MKMHWRLDDSLRQYLSQEQVATGIVSDVCIIFAGATSEGVKRVNQAKGRPENNPLVIMVSGRKILPWIDTKRLDPRISAEGICRLIDKGLAIHQLPAIPGKLPNYLGNVDEFRVVSVLNTRFLRLRRFQLGLEELFPKGIVLTSMNHRGEPPIRCSLMGYVLSGEYNSTHFVSLYRLDMGFPKGSFPIVGHIGDTKIIRKGHWRRLSGIMSQY